MKKYFWDRNDFLIEDPTVNVRFEELVMMSNPELEAWVDHLRASVLKVWDEEGVPPLAGKTDSEMREVFREMSGTHGSTISTYLPKSATNNVASGTPRPYIDELDGKANVIINTGSLGSCVSQFFPTMMKAKINYQTKVDDVGTFNGYAVYDMFANDKFRNRMILGCRRHFKRDSFYRYSISVPERSANSSKAPKGLISVDTGAQWIQNFSYHQERDLHGFWLSRVEESEEGDTNGSGYTQVDVSKFLWVSKAEIGDLYKKGFIKPENLRNLIPEIEFVKSEGEIGDVHYLNGSLITRDLKDNEQYHIRFFKKETRIFPNGFTAFKIGYIQVAVNFPPMIAKYLYEKYTDHCKGQDVINIYDPSSGWGGRIAGAMTVMDDRHIHYIGTDPNTDNVIDELGITRYEYLAEFINEALQKFGYEPHTYDVYRLGSEVIGKDKKFKKYKGKLDLVFTSPPYFNREGYSEDETQSLKKFPFYDGWRDGFLRPTLETAYGFLKPDRYLLWNIADIKVGSQYYPLEKDSREILESLGAEFVGVEKMVLANMPGANRVGEDGKPTCKNFCKVNNKWHKTELVFVFRKPK